MSHFGNARAQLVRGLEDHETARVFEEARGRRAIFQEYPTLVAALEDIVGLNGEYGRRRDAATKDTLLRALLDEQREHPHRVWTAALTAAFYPALTKLKARVHSSVDDDDDKRSLVLAAWLEAIARVARVSDRDRLDMRLVQAAEREAFRVVRKAWRERKLLRNLGAVAKATGAMEPFAQGRREAVPHAGAMLVEIREATRRAHDGDDHELAKALDAAATLRERVRLLYPDLSTDDMEQMYQRLKRRSTRAVARVKSAADRAEREATKDLIRTRPAIRRRRRKGPG